MAYHFDADSGVWTRKGYGGIGYSDGDEVEARLEAIVDEVDDRSSLSVEFIPHLTDWASEYHFSRQRHCLIRPLGIKPGDRVLELGCGCGAITRYLGEIGAAVTAVEGSPRRARIARKRCQGLENVNVYCDNLVAFESEEKFDWVLLIGVLEYAPVFSDSPDPVADYLARARRHLALGGRLVIAIENKLGLKYFNGRPEDHLGKPFYGVNDLYASSDPATFGRRELEGLLADAGLAIGMTCFPFPDYKLPTVVISDAGLKEPDFNAGDLLSGIESRDYSGLTPPLFCEPLSSQTVYENGLLADLANSFLIVASRHVAEAREDIPLAWYFSIGYRKPEYCTQTVFEGGGETISVRKTALRQESATARSQLADGSWLAQDLSGDEYVSGRLSVLDFMKTKLRAATETDLGDWFLRWFDETRKSAHVAEGDDPARLESWQLPGNMLDAVPSNVIVTGQGLRLIDQEWIVQDDIPLGWLLYRALRWTLPLGVSETLEKIDGVAIFERICARSGLRFERGSLNRYAKLEKRLMRQVNVPTRDISVEIDSLPTTHAALSEVASSLNARVYQTRVETLEAELSRLRDEMEKTRAAHALESARYQSLLEQHEHLCKLHARERHTVIRPILRLGYRQGLKVFRKLPLSTKIRLKSAATRFLPIPGAGDAAPASPVVGGEGRSSLPEVWRDSVLAAKGDRCDIVVFPVIDWDFRFQRPQHLASGLARKGYRVFYLATTFFPAEAPAYRIEKSPVDNVFLVRLGVPAPHPNIYTSSLSDAQLRHIREALHRLYDECGMKEVAALINLPFWRRVATGLPSTILVYDCMDHHAGFSTNAADVQLEEEERLLQEAEVVISSSERLRENIRPVSDSILVRNAGDIEFFAKRPDKLAIDTESPVVGYYGAISDWFDVELVRKAASRFPDWRFVLVGEVTNRAIQSIRKLPNIELVGEAPYAALPGYLHAFDVCVIPFLINELTLCTNPVKIYEYMAAGKPVVATDMPELRLLDDICHVARDHEEFLGMLDVAMAEASDGALAERRVAWARSHDWRHRVDQLSRAIDESWPRVSVIVLTYNNLEYTRACLDSVMQYTRYPNLEIIVVDNASTDETPEFLQTFRKAHPETRIILNDENRGFAAGNNVGLEAATGDYLVILNNDTYVTEGWLHGLVRHLRRHPGIGLIGPVTNNIGNEARIDLNYQSMEEMRRQARDFTERHVNDLLKVDTVAFFCVAMPRKIYQQIGGLDEAFGLGFFEDDDYCRRVKQAGYEIAIANDVFVHHHLSASFNKLGDEKRQALFEANKAIYEKKWGAWRPHEYR